MEKRKSAGKIILKVVIILFSSIILLFLLFIGTLNIFKHFYYSDYFDSLTKVGKNAGLNEGYVPQGITYNDDVYYTTGYMKDNSPSRIYIISEDDHTYVTLTSEGKDFFGHTGGLQYANGSFYLANEGLGLFTFSENVFDNVKDGDKVEIGSPKQMNNHTSFVFSRDKYLYVGEFNNDAKYQCTNAVTYNGKTHNAIVSKYFLNDLDTPIAIYSIPNEIQGFCINEEGRVVLSRSYAVTSSNFFIYDVKDIIDTKTKYDGAPLYFLDTPTRDIEAPAMSEDLDMKDGKVITLFESACNKYYFGKLFFANYIAMLDF